MEKWGVNSTFLVEQIAGHGERRQLSVPLYQRWLKASWLEVLVVHVRRKVGERDLA